MDCSLTYTNILKIYYRHQVFVFVFNTARKGDNINTKRLIEEPHSTVSNSVLNLPNQKHEKEEGNLILLRRIEFFSSCPFVS